MTPTLQGQSYNEKIEINKLDAIQTKTSNIYKEHYYFMLNNKYVVTNLQRNKPISRFQTYINYLLDKERGNKLFEFTPIIKPTPEIRLSEVKEIRISDAPTMRVSNNTKSNNDYIQKIKNLGKEVLSNILRDSQDFNEMELEHIVSAELLIKFAKPRKKDEENAKRRRLILKPFAPCTDLFSVKTSAITLTFITHGRPTALNPTG